MVADVLDDIDREDTDPDGPAMPLMPTADLYEEIWSRLPDPVRNGEWGSKARPLMEAYVDDITGRQVAAYVVANKMTN